MMIFCLNPQHLPVIRLEFYPRDSIDTLTVYVQIKRAANATLEFKNIEVISSVLLLFSFRANQLPLLHLLHNKN